MTASSTRWSMTAAVMLVDPERVSRPCTGVATKAVRILPTHLLSIRRVVLLVEEAESCPTATEQREVLP
jgi:hypothetical protein